MTLDTFFGQISTFTTIFLGIFIEAVPFLLLGTLASGILEVFVSKEEIARFIPRNTVLAALVGTLLGFAFPVCECGVVPLTRRLYNKGLPISAGIAFLLAAPIVNPVVLASTYAAYGWSTILAARFGFGAAVALIVGLIFSLNPQSSEILRAASPNPAEETIVTHKLAVPLSHKFQLALKLAGDEFFEMGVFLVIGAALAALMQTLVPQKMLLALGTGPVKSVLMMQLLAFLLSVCSTVDAFLSLAFVNTFSTGSIIAFLVFGPMVDIKSTLMFWKVFKERTVIYLIILPFLFTLLIGVIVNLNLSW